MDDNEKLLTQLAVISEHHSAQIDDHEERIRTLEDVTTVVQQISVNVEKQGTNIDKLTSAIEMLKNTQNQMNFTMKEAELKEQYSTYIKIKELLSHIDWKKVIILIVSGTGVSAIVKAIIDLIA